MAAKRLPTCRRSSCTEPLLISCHAFFRHPEFLSQVRGAICCWCEAFLRRIAATPHHHTHLWLQHGSPLMLFQSAHLQSTTRLISSHYPGIKKIDGLSFAILAQSIRHPREVLGI